MNNDLIKEMSQNFIEYAAAVNTDRAIPDATSGLKPVALRILYDAFENKIDHNLYATKIPKTKEEFLDMEIEITPSKMKFYRYFKVSDVYNAFKNGRNNSHIAELLGTSRGTIIKALNIRS